LVGIAHSYHNSVDDCVVVTFSDHNVKEDPKEITKMMKAQEHVQKITKESLTQQLNKLKD